MTAQHGGKRIGAGRKSRYGPTERIEFRCPEAIVEKLRDDALENGITLSEQLRKVLERFYKHG